MKKRGKHDGLVLLLLAIPLALALTACGGSKGDKGDTGAAGTDLTEPTAKTHGTFNADILPLFTQNNKFFEGSLACATCHKNNTSTSFHAINFNSYDGILLGPTDEVTTGEDLLGRGSDCTDLTSVSGVCTPVWDESALAHRLRDTRMPPGWTFDLDQGNRNTPEILAIQGWLTDGALNQTGVDCTGTKICFDTPLSNLSYYIPAAGDTTVVLTGTAPAGGDTVSDVPATDWQLAEGTTVGGLFTSSGAFFLGSQACTECHSDPTAHFSWHGLDMSSYPGILKGPQDEAAYTEDLLGRPAGCDLTLASVSSSDGCVPVPDDSALLARLRDTRMPPGWPFELGQTNRDMWAIQQIKNWVDAGAPPGSF